MELPLDPAITRALAPAVLFSDETFGDPKAQDVPYVRVGLVCAEGSLHDLRASLSRLHYFLMSVSDRFAREIEGKVMFKLLTDDPPRAAAVQKAILQICQLLYPHGPIAPIVVVSYRDDNRALAIAERTCVPRDAASATGLLRDGMLAATALVWQEMVRRYQSVLASDHKLYGRIVADNFRSATQRYAVKLVDNAMWYPLRADHRQPYIPEVVFVPTRHEYILQLADVIVHFTWRHIQGEKNTLGAAVLDSARGKCIFADLR